MKYHAASIVNRSWLALNHSLHLGNAWPYATVEAVRANDRNRSREAGRVSGETTPSCMSQAGAN